MDQIESKIHLYGVISLLTTTALKDHYTPVCAKHFTNCAFRLSLKTNLRAVFILPIHPISDICLLKCPDQLLVSAFVPT